MAITYVGSASNPADNASNTVNPTVVDPSTISMVSGDLVILYAQVKTISLTPVISQAGGQTWNSEAVYASQTGMSARLFWCRFNGTWSANPSVNLGGTSGNTVVMHVFRPSAGSNTWEVDVAFASATFAATTGAVTIPTRNTVADSTVSLATWGTADDNSWTSLTGTGWVVTGLAQYRNLAGTDASSTFAHRIMTVAGATNAVSKTQTVVTNDAGVYGIITFKEVAGAGPTTHEADVAEAINITDTGDRVMASASVVAEGITITDVGLRIVDFNLSVPEGVTFVDTEGRDISSDESVSEGIGFTDSSNRSAEYGGSVAEGLTMSDSQVKNANMDAARPEPITLTDALSRGLDIGSAVSEGFSVGDAPTRISTLEKVAEELFTVLDTVLTSGIWNKTTEEGITFTEVFQRGIDLYGEAMEAIALSDEVDSNISQDVLRAEIMSFIDSLGVSVIWNKTTNEVVGFQDSMQGLGTFNVDQTEGLVLSDSLGSNADVIAVNLESITLSELIEAQINKLWSDAVNEGISISAVFLASIVRGQIKNVIVIGSSTRTKITGGKGVRVIKGGKGNSHIQG